MRKTIIAAALTAILALFLPVSRANADFPPSNASELTAVVTEDTIGRLESYTRLTRADLTGSTCYAAITDYASRHPEVTVIYTVDVGGTAVPSTAAEIALNDGAYTTAMLLDNLPYLPNLGTIVFPGIGPDEVTAAQLQAVAPGVTLRYSIDIGGTLCDSDAQVLNLSFLTRDGVAQAAARLPLLAKLEQVELMRSDGNCSLSPEDVVLLQNAAPDTLFHYTFNLFGKTVSTTDEEISFLDQAIGTQPGAEDTLRQALTILRGCRRFVLDNCSFDNEVLARIREEFRGQTNVVWRVWFSTDGSSLTDREMLRVTFHLKDSNCHDLIYCEGTKYLDIGHNETLSTVEFVKGMPNLVAVIASGSPITDLSPFAGCSKLEMLEVAFCGLLKDISPLAECYSLERLNIGFTKVSDLSVLDDKPICVLIDTNSWVSNKESSRFEKLHPDALVQHYGAQPYGYPWRYTEGMNGFNEYYTMLREIFDYDNGTNTHR